jgi:hypothetical protein
MLIWRGWVFKWRGWAMGWAVFEIKIYDIFLKKKKKKKN